jgi:hypothetical protein
MRVVSTSVLHRDGLAPGLPLPTASACQHASAARDTAHNRAPGRTPWLGTARAWPARSLWRFLPTCAARSNPARRAWCFSNRSTRGLGRVRIHVLGHGGSCPCLPEDTSVARLTHTHKKDGAPWRAVGLCAGPMERRCNPLDAHAGPGPACRSRLGVGQARRKRLELLRKPLPAVLERARRKPRGRFDSLGCAPNPFSSSTSRT